MTALTEIILALPRWIEAHVSKPGCSLATAEDRMRFVIRLAELNVAHGSGGPFGAAVFDMRTTQLLSVGVNAVVESRCSAAHAEMMAIMLAQRVAESYDLAQSAHQCELVTSVEPCAMCLGAIPWSGIRRLVCGARREDACAIGFDEGCLRVEMKLHRVWVWSGVVLLAVAVAVGVLLPSFIKARPASCGRACINNLRIIDAAKEQAVYNKELPPDADCDAPANMASVNPYIKNNATPVCPDGGTYTYGAVTNEPTCSLFNPRKRKTYDQATRHGARQATFPFRS